MPDINDLRDKWLKNGCGSREEFDAIVEIVEAMTAPAPKAKPEPEMSHATGYAPKAKAKHK